MNLLKMARDDILGGGSSQRQRQQQQQVRAEQRNARAQAQQRETAVLVAGRSVFHATCAMGSDLYVLSPAAPKEKKSKKKGLVGGMSKMMKVGKKVLFGTTKRPKLVPMAAATRKAFLCFCPTTPQGAGSAVMYGQTYVLRANFNGGALLTRIQKKDGEFEFHGTEIDEDTATVTIMSATGKGPAQPARMGDTIMLTTNNGSHVMVFTKGKDGVIELIARPVADVPAGQAAMFIARPPPLSAMQKQEGDVCTPS